MDSSRRGPFGWLPPTLRRLEHRLGAQRDDRTLWIWMVPASTVVITFVVLAFLGMEGKVDLYLTVPMALTLSIFLGSLSAFYLTAASSDERDADDDDDGGRRPTAIGPLGPSPQAASRLRTPAPQGPPAERPAEEPATVAAGVSERR